MHIIGTVVRKSIQANLSLILNSLLFKNISDNPKHLSMPGIYSQLYSMLVVTIFLGVGKDRQECVCKCNRHRKRKPIYVELYQITTKKYFCSIILTTCTMHPPLKLRLYYMFQYNTTLLYQKCSKSSKYFHLRRDSEGHQVIWFYQENCLKRTECRQ